MKTEKIFSALKKEALRNMKSASYFFYGDKRVDLLFYALEFSKMIMTGDIKDKSEIEKIKKNIESFQHPDIKIINRQNENIKIDEIREIIYEAIESPYNSPKKIFILSGIENLRKESSNALLKILEEPPENVYFILLSGSMNVIPTIKSRTVNFILSGSDSKELGVDSEVYYFFDGNESDIKKYKKSGISLEKYKNKVSSIEIAFKNLIEMKNLQNGEKKTGLLEEELETVILYNMSIRYISFKLRILDTTEVYRFINMMDTEFKTEKAFLTGLLGKIIITSNRLLNGDEIKKLIHLKNSIKSNVNLRSILFNFFNILQTAIYKND